MRLIFAIVLVAQFLGISAQCGTCPTDTVCGEVISGIFRCRETCAIKVCKSGETCTPDQTGAGNCTATTPPTSCGQPCQPYTKCEYITKYSDYSCMETCELVQCVVGEHCFMNTTVGESQCIPNVTTSVPTSTPTSLPAGQSMSPGTVTSVPAGQSMSPGSVTSVPAGQSMSPGSVTSVPAGQSMSPGSVTSVPAGQSMSPGSVTSVPTSTPTSLPAGQSMSPGTSGPAGSSSPTSVTSVPAGQSVAPTIAPTAVPTPVPRPGCACLKGQICVESQTSGQFTCVTNGCAFKNCGSGKSCKITATGPACEAVAVDPCEPNPCPDTTICVLEGTNHTCEPVVTDPCAACSPTQQCSYNAATGVACVDLDACTVARRQKNLENCIAPKKCELQNNMPQCVDPPIPSSCNPATCEQQSKVCGPNGECVENKCSDFSWPPAEVQFCAPNGGCPAGSKCTGCTASGFCDKVTGETTFGNDCRPTCETFTLTCDVSDKSSWTADEMRDCCTVAGVGCVSYDCLDDMPVEQWSGEQRTYCCNSTGKGCPKPAGEYDCLDGSESINWEFAKRKWCCENRQVGCPVGFDCRGVTTSWTSQQSEYCCKTKDKGCTTNNGYDCMWNNKTTSPWSDNQRNWCCSNKGVRCPPKDPFTCPDDVSSYTGGQRSWCCANKNRGCMFECQKKAAERKTWPEDRRKYCCLYEGISCKANANDFDCFDTTSEWTAERKTYCCNEQDIGCQTDCTADQSTLSTAEQGRCCETKGLACTGSAPLDPEIPSGGESKRFRLSFRGSWGSASRSPLRMVRKFRMSLLAASKTFRAGKVVVVVKYMGALVSGNNVAPNSTINNWQFTLKAAWNVDISPIPSEIASQGRSVSTLSQTLNEAQTGDDGIYFDYTAAGLTADIDSFNSELSMAVSDEKKKPSMGSFSTNNEGYSLILTDSNNELIASRAAAGIVPEPTKKDDNDDESSLTWLWILLGCLGVVCLGAGIFIVHRRKQNEQKLDDFLTDVEGFHELANTTEQYDMKMSPTADSVVAKV